MTDVWLGQWRLAGAPPPCMEASMSPGPGEVSASAGSTALLATSIGPAVRPRGPPFVSTFIGRSATGFLHMVLHTPVHGTRRHASALCLATRTAWFRR